MPFHQITLSWMTLMPSQRSMHMVCATPGGAPLTEETGRQERGQDESSVEMWGRMTMKKWT